MLQYFAAFATDVASSEPPNLAVRSESISREDMHPSMARKMFPVGRSFARVRKLAKHRSVRRSIYSIEMESSSGWSSTKKRPDRIKELLGTVD